jgi:lipoprotein signal peptidase
MASAADRRLFWGVASAVVVFDLATKFVAEARLTYRPLSIVGEWVRLRLVYNEGAAFGLHLGEYSRWIFFGLALLALAVLGSMVRTTRPGDRFRLGALALICGGAAGNLIDPSAARRGWWTSSTLACAPGGGPPSTWPTLRSPSAPSPRPLAVGRRS